MSLKPQTGRVRKVETLPPDGTGSPPLLAPRWPLVPVLPTPVVDGARYCVGASYDVAVEYLGRSVAELNGPDTIYGSSPCANIALCDWEVSGYFRDVTAGSSNYPPIYQMLNRINGHEGFKIVFTPDNDLRFEARSSAGGSFVATEIAGTFNDGNEHFFSVEKIGNSIICKADSTSFTMDCTGWTAWDDITDFFISDASADIRPLQFRNIQQSLNGTLIDNIPCDESTGTGLRNTQTASRPATLSDANAHALAWVPQASKQYGVWVWKWGANLNGVDYAYCDVASKAMSRDEDFDLSFEINRSSLISSGTMLFALILATGDALGIAVSPDRFTLNLWQYFSGSLAESPIKVFDGSSVKIQLTQVSKLCSIFIDNVFSTSVQLANQFASSIINTIQLGPISENKNVGLFSNFSFSSNKINAIVPLSENSGSTFFDVSGNGNNLTLVDGSPATAHLQGWFKQ